MKIICIFLLSLICIQNDAQNPPQLNVDNIDLKWAVPIVDSNFVKEEFDEFSSKYWGFNFLQVLENDGDLLLLNGSRTQSPYGGVDGCLIHNIDKTTGAINWTHHKNINSGNERRSSYNLTAMSITIDNQIHLLGLTDLDSLRKDIPNFTFRAQPMLTIIDSNSGLMIENKKGDENLSSYFNYSTSIFPHTNTNGDIFGLTPLQKRENNLNYNTFEFIGIDSNFNFQEPHLSDVRVLLTDTLAGLPNTPSSMYPINRDSLLMFYYDPYFEDLSLSPQGLFMQVVDVTSIDNINVVNEFYIDENIYYPQAQISGTAIYPQVFDNYIIVTQRPYINIEESLDRFIWLQWYDLNGNLLAFVPVAGDSNPYDIIHPIGFKNNKMYFLGERDDVFIVCFLEEGAEDLVEVKSFRITNTEFHNVSVSRIKILNDEESVFMRVNCKYSNEIGRESDYSYMTLVGIEELGILTNTEEIKVSAKQLNIHPNPGFEFIQLDINFDGMIRIYDSAGILTLSQEYKPKEAIDISSLYSGVYTVKFQSANINLTESLVVIK